MLYKTALKALMLRTEKPEAGNLSQVLFVPTFFHLKFNCDKKCKSLILLSGQLWPIQMV